MSSPRGPSPSPLLPLPARPALPERAGVDAHAVASNGDADGADAGGSGMPRRWLRVADWSGRALLTLGILTGLFVAHQIWGTRVLQAREQDALRDRFDEQIEALDTADDAGSSDGSVGEARAATPVPIGDSDADDRLALMEIPALGLETVAVDGIGDDALRKGPGHYPGTAQPGEAGNAAFAGHRVTYGAPFYALDRLEAGDEIVITTVRGRFIYLVREQRIVAPDEVSVLDPTSDPRLTLTTCHPRLSARERLVVVATLLGEPLPPSDPAASESETPTLASASTLDGRAGAGLAGLDAGFVLWTALTAAIGGAWWWMFRRRRGFLTWFGGALPFAAALVFFFGQVEGLIPATF